MSVLKKLRQIRTIIRDHRANKYISYKEALLNWYGTRNNNYKMYNLEGLKKFKNSDTIFILGNGPSLNLLKGDHIQAINSQDSFGISYSFVKNEIVPNFFLVSMENDTRTLQFFKDTFSNYRQSYRDVIVFYHSTSLFRMAHPRLTPYFYPEKAKCCFFWKPKSIQIKNKRHFVDSDFEKTLAYRGTLSVVLDLILKLEYKNIVLLGVDLDKSGYFYEKIKSFEEYVRITHEGVYGPDHATTKNKKYPSMHPKPGNEQPFDEYLYALKGYLKRKKDINLFIGFKDSILYPGIPAYFD